MALTEEQRGIVDDHDGELLVSAAAGSGKTRVLVERLLDRVDKDGMDIDRFLVITYTKAAAAELRSRIAQELSARLAKRPQDSRLRRQSILVYKAQISTIHAFCATLLRESGYLLDLDPDFRLCDEAEQQVLRLRVLNELLDRKYEDLEPNSPFAALADTLGSGRDDSRLLQIVLDIFTRVQSHPDPVRWLERQREVWSLDGVEDAAQTPWGALLLSDARRKARQVREQLALALQLSGTDELLQMNYADSLATTLEAVDRLLAAESWDDAFDCLPIPFPAAGRKRKRSVPLLPNEEAQIDRNGERIKALRDRCKELLGELEENLGGSSEALLTELALSRPAVQALMDLVLEFQQAFEKEKRRRNLMDFSDLEHYAVRLLTDERGEPTPLALSWQERLDEVMVDEYQDTNQVQNAIFSAISAGGRKLFQVGDVKQSIYRFRLADPAIFQNKFRRYPDGDLAPKNAPRRRVLSRNFRSRPQVLEGCNDLFRNVMSEEFGELIYDSKQALVPGRSFPTPDAGPDASDPYALELDLLDLTCLKEQEGGSKDLLEARFAAKRIQELLSAPLMVEDGDGLRPLRPSDVMILLRSPGPVLRCYLQALGEAGIPWSVETSEDFFASTEVNAALAILQIVDNPRQDVPLIAALRSPVYGFSGDKLALIRSKAKGDFYTALRQAAEDGDAECTQFLDHLSQLRFGVGERTCRQLIWHIYEQLNLLGIFGAMDRGRERQENLLSLYALAGQLENSGCCSLFQFLLRLERMRNANAKFSTAGGSGGGEGVSILSIHRSKGLERPVVLVCGLNRRLNRDDLRQPVLFHPELGVGPKGLDQERMLEYDTLARRAVARKLEQEMMAEELRLLYVAMTRAREKLILTMGFPNGLKTLADLAEDVSAPVSPMALECQPSPGMWVLLHALSRPESETLRDMAKLNVRLADNLGPAWNIRWLDGTRLAQPLEAPGHFAAPPDPTASETEEDDLFRRLSWRYPHMAAANLPSKLTATQVKGRAADQEAIAGALPPRRDDAVLYRPDFIAQKHGLTPAQRGSALHLAMQYLPLEENQTPETIQAELERLTEAGFLTPLQRQAIPPERLAAFFRHPLGLGLIRAAKREREFKFSLLVPAKDYFPDGGEEQILFQGVVDAWFDDGPGVTVIDFKSDFVRPGEEPAAAEKHRLQVEAYSRALSAILKRPVLHKFLWFFATDTPAEL